MRLEVVFLHGGIYLDCDSTAVDGFDEYGTLFHWPFVTHDLGNYMNICNCLFGFEKNSGFLDFALDATRQNCLKYDQCGVMSGAGPGFLTAALKRYNRSDILLIENKYMLHIWPGGPPERWWNVMYQSFEHKW